MDKMIKMRCDAFLISLTIFLLLILFIPKVQLNAQELPSGSYQQTCTAMSINGNELEGFCRTRNGDRFLYTNLDISNCVGDIWNADGRLGCRKLKSEMPQGSYQITCQDCDVSDSILECKCRKRNGRWVQTWINLNNCDGYISNQNGRLECY